MPHPSLDLDSLALRVHQAILPVAPLACAVRIAPQPAIVTGSVYFEAEPVRPTAPHNYDDVIIGVVVSVGGALLILSVVFGAPLVKKQLQQRRHRKQFAPNVRAYL